jgi:hypothetical protein
MLDIIAGLLKNPVLLGAIAVALVWFLRKAKWDVDGPKAIWLTYVVALCIAVAGELLSGGFPAVITCPLAPTDPPSFVVCVFQVIQNVLAWAGVVFAVATVVYKVLRSKMVLGERI